MTFAGMFKVIQSQINIHSGTPSRAAVYQSTLEKKLHCSYYTVNNCASPSVSNGTSHHQSLLSMTG